MIIRIDPESPNPIYSQITEEVKHAVGVGAFKPGDPLPSIRTLAANLGINRNTVLKAYDILEREGYVETKKGSGSYISKAPPALSMDERLDIVYKSMDRMLMDAYYLQIPIKRLREILNERIREFVLHSDRKPSFRSEDR